MANGAPFLSEFLFWRTVDERGCVPFWSPAAMQLHTHRYLFFFRVFSYGAPFLVEMCRDLESHACLLQRRLVTCFAFFFKMLFKSIWSCWVLVV